MDTLYNESWEPIISPLLAQDFMNSLSLFLKAERTNFEVFPTPEYVFNAMRLTPFQDIKVVILGQDPYHNIGQAHGLSFSVPTGILLPPSLKNIFAELSTDIDGFKTPMSGDLSKWAAQGVLLLNATLTVRAHEAGSHQKKGWEQFTDQIINSISTELEHVVFILWGSYAQKKIKLINEKKHLVLQAVHPSPLSVYRGFYGSKPFSKANRYLVENNKKPIDWLLA